ncbi:MAG TPA: periplasmic heavy metal sensor [Opitutaceae bacterium]
MKPIVGFFVAVIAVAALSSFCTLRWVAAQPSPLSTDAHEWLHAELDLTPEQRKAIEPIELRFAAKERLMNQQMREANHELALAIGRGKAYSPEVASAVEKIHHIMGELQKASIEHVFEMRQVLTPKQGDKLLSLAQRALDQEP